MDRNRYDGPEDEQTAWGRALVLLVGAGVIFGIFWAIYNGHTPFGG